MRRSLLSILIALLSPLTLMAENEQPIITLRSSTSSFTVSIGGYSDGYIDVDAGNGQEEKEIVATDFDSETGELTGTILTFTPTQGEVKIYGEADNISFLNLNGCYLTHVDVSALRNLSFLYINNNEDLDGLDLTGNTALRYLEAVDCPMTNGFIIGEKPELQVMMIAQTGNFRDFDTSRYPKLRYLSCWGNPEITSIDVSKCPNLIQLSCDGTSISSLDVTHNENLQILNIEDTRITSIDLSRNVNLLEFYGSHDSGTINTDVKLKDIDLSGNPKLMRLRISGNNFTSVDVRNKRYLRYLNVGNNLLTNIDLSGCEQLSEVVLSNNYFGFSTLPLPELYWETYDYYQHNLQSNKTYAENTVLDFGSMVLREGTNTTCALFQTDETNANNLVALDENYYTFDASTGKVTLLKATPDSVFLAFANDAFPAITLTSMPLRTGKFMVKTAEEFGKDIAAVTFTPAKNGEIAFAVGVAGASAQNPKAVLVDFGNGVKKNFTINTDGRSTAANVMGTAQSGSTVTVYTSQDDLLSALEIKGVELEDIDVTNSRALRFLTLADTRLTKIDLGWNKMLERLEMTGNNFGTLNIAGVNYAYNKSLLGDIFLSNNKLTEVTLTDNNYTLRNIDLSNNLLTNISFKDADRMETLNLANNQLSELNVNYCTLMTSLNVSGNKLTSLTLPTETAIKELHVENNALDFTTLPQLSNMNTYVYAPQQNIKIAAMGPGVDLSAQMVGGQTSFVWKKDGVALTAGQDYRENEGEFIFNTELVGSTLMCEITNSLFPGLTLSTTGITVAAMPTNLLASFTTPETQEGTISLLSSEPSNTICVDWSGEGTNMVYYNLVNTGLYTFPATSKAGATAKVYSYNEKSNLTVFGLSGFTLDDMDARGMRQLSKLTVKDAGLSSILWPESPSFAELDLSGNNFSSLELGEHAADMMMMALNENKLESFDASRYPNLLVLSLFGNRLKDITLNNPNLFQLDLGRNNLTSVDLSKVPSMNQLALTENNLESVDVSQLSMLAALYLDRNKFRFSTLPQDKGYSKYTYANQGNLSPEVVDGSVDLSSEAVVAGGSATTYRWFVGTPTLNMDLGELEGEELFVDDEFTVSNGITYFNLSYDGLVCAMTNEAFPGLILYTVPLDVKTAIKGVSEDSHLDVSVSGRTITARMANGAEALLIDMSGRIVGRATAHQGVVTLPVSNPGVYTIVTRGKGARILVD